MNLSFKHISILILLIFTSLLSHAITDEEVYEAVEAAKAAPKNTALNLKAGMCLQDIGDYQTAIPYLLKGGNTGNLYLAEIYYNLYEFEKALSYLDKYVAKRTKDEETKDKSFFYNPEAENLDWVDVLRSRIELGEAMLDRVEKIQVIDSISVPEETFFKFYKLATSAGSVIDGEEIERITTPDQLKALDVIHIQSPAFASEDGSTVVWTGSDNLGNMKIFESRKLSDGTFDAPTQLFDYTNIFGEKDGSMVTFPFLMADGMTMYFAADGENSLGDLDIFISRKEGDDFLQPSNIGMPYNSPANDYLFAIDEQTGLGWWATDRTKIPGMVTIYVFIPQELRINYPPETTGLRDYARITSISATQDADKKYADLLNNLDNLSGTEGKKLSEEFVLALPDGRVLHRLSDFSNRNAGASMRKYLSEMEDLKDLNKDLERLRNIYYNGDNSISQQILSSERLLEKKRDQLSKLKNEVINLEVGN